MGRRCRWLVLLLLSAVALGRAQVLLSPPIRENPSDLAALAEEESRNDLPCKVTPVKPFVGFDLRYHSGYTVSVPVEDLAPYGDQLLVLMRITPESDPADAAYLADSFALPRLNSDLHGEATFPGEFILGPGHYQVKWMIRGQEGRICSSSWELDAEPADWLHEVSPGLSPNAVSEYVKDPFQPAVPVERDRRNQLHVKLLVNFSPGDPEQVVLSPQDLQAIVSIMRTVVQEPRFNKFSLVAFSTRDEKILFRQDDAPEIDFAGLGNSVGNLTFGTVDYARLMDPTSEARFLTSLLTENTEAQHQPPDAVVIIGPKVFLEKGIPKETLREGGLPRCPVFYLNYMSDPTKNPWRDAVTVVLRALRGFEYVITRPRDLASALLDMRSQLADLRQRSLLPPANPNYER